MEKIRTILTSLKATKYIPNTYDVYTSGNGDNNIQKERKQSVEQNHSKTRKLNVVYPEHYVQIKSRFGKYQNGKYMNYRFSTKFLSWTFALLLASLLIVLIVGNSRSPTEYCSSAECVRSAAIIRLSLNANVNPCENFFQFTCGGWRKEHPLYPGRESYSKFSLIFDSIFQAVSKFLSTENSLHDIEPVKQTRIFYKSCLDKDNRETMGFAAILEYLEVVGLPKTPKMLSTDQETELKFDWVKVEAKIKRIFSMDVFIGFRVLPNRLNTPENLMYIGRQSERCQMLRPYKRKNHDKHWIIVIKYIINIFLRNSTNYAPAEDLLKEAVAVIEVMTTKVERFIISKTYSADDNEYHMGYTYKQLQDQIDEYTLATSNRTFPQFLKRFVENIFDGTSNNARELLRKSVYIKRREKPYIFYIISYLLKIPDEHIELYMWWSVVVCMIMNTSSDVRKFIYQQYGSYNPSQQTRINRVNVARVCQELSMREFSFVIAYTIANESFLTGSGLKIKSMVEELRESFIESIEQMNWMDEKAKAAIMEKSENMYTFIGFPKWLFVEGELEKYYKGMNMNSTTYLHNVMEIIKRISVDIFEKPITRNRTEMGKDWPKNPLVVNAFNSIITNSIIIPLAIVSFPFYNLGLEVLNFGTIGCILGHELIHGFDSIGWKFDKYGSYREWLPTDLNEIFQNKSVCFKKQYDNATIDGVKGKVSGVLTLSENIADNGGLGHALAAYRKFRKRFGREAKLPGFENFTDEQMFFIAFGNIWCQNISPSLLERLLKRDPHSPNAIRVNMAVSNSDDFAKAFSCPKGSKMNPFKKCKIW